MAIPYVRSSVPVDGGDLCVGRWGTGDRIVVASHGITANHLSFSIVAEHIVDRSDGEVSVVGIDHRGRAGSAEVAGPFGLVAHGDDVAAVMDHFGVERTVLLGHSLGGFIIANTAERHPSRCERLVLIDGGVPFPGGDAPVDPDVDVEAVIHAVIGPALARLDMRFASIEAYVDFFRAHPAFQPPNEWTSAIEDYVRYDAVIDADGQVRSSVSKEVVLVDGGAAIAEPESAAAIERSAVPSTMLWCPRGLLDETPGLYTRDYLAVVTDRLPHVTATEVADTNHYTVVTTSTGARAVADAVLD
ncbi:MAG: alpha/beta fold hydrolase [Actinomycetota bacterium]